MADAFDVSVCAKKFHLWRVLASSADALEPGFLSRLAKQVDVLLIPPSAVSNLVHDCINRLDDIHQCHKCRSKGKRKKQIINHKNSKLH